MKKVLAALLIIALSGCGFSTPMPQEDQEEMDHTIDGTQTMRGGFPDVNLSK